VIKLLPHNSVDLIIIDPPYEMTKDKWDKRWSEDEWVPLLIHIWQVLKKGGRLLVFGKKRFFREVCTFIDDDSFLSYDELIWQHDGMDNWNTNQQEMSNSERIGVWYRTVDRDCMNLPKRGDHSDVLHFKKEGVRGRPREDGSMKPIDLMRYLVQRYGGSGAVVLDFCMKTGICGRGALLEGRRFIGVEADAANYAQCLKVWHGFLCENPTLSPPADVSAGSSSAAATVGADTPMPDAPPAVSNAASGDHAVTVASSSAVPATGGDGRGSVAPGNALLRQLATERESRSSTAQQPPPSTLEAAVSEQVAVTDPAANSQLTPQCLLCHGDCIGPSYPMKGDGQPCWRGETDNDRHWYCQACLIDRLHRDGPTCIGCGVPPKPFAQIYTLGLGATLVSDDLHGPKCVVCGAKYSRETDKLIVCGCDYCKAHPEHAKAVHLSHTDDDGWNRKWRKVPTGEMYYVNAETGESHAPVRIQMLEPFAPSYRDSHFCASAHVRTICKRVIDYSNTIQLKMPQREAMPLRRRVRRIC